MVPIPDFSCTVRHEHSCTLSDRTCQVRCYITCCDYYIASINQRKQSFDIIKHIDIMKHFDAPALHAGQKIKNHDHIYL